MPHRLHRTDAACCYRRLTFSGLHVCLLDTSVSPAKTDKPIESPLGADSRGRKEKALDGDHGGTTWRIR